MDKLNNDQINGLLKIMPESTDVEAIQNYQGDPALLGEAEKFYATLIKVPE